LQKHTLALKSFAKNFLPALILKIKKDSQRLEAFREIYKGFGINPSKKPAQSARAYFAAREWQGITQYHVAVQYFSD